MELICFQNYTLITNLKSSSNLYIFIFYARFQLMCDSIRVHGWPFVADHEISAILGLGNRWCESIHSNTIFSYRMQFVQDLSISGFRIYHFQIFRPDTNTYVVVSIVSMIGCRSGRIGFLELERSGTCRYVHEELSCPVPIR